MQNNTFDNIEIKSLSEESFTYGLQALADRDGDLANILNTLGNPPRWQRKPGFSTLIRLILEQQVSLAAAKAVFERLGKTVSPLTPENFLSIEDTQLRTIGFSRQKTRYGRALANAIAVQKVKNLKTRPTSTELEAIAENWRPWRAIAFYITVITYFCLYRLLLF